MCPSLGPRSAATWVIPFRGVASADNENYRLIIDYLRDHGPVEREPALRSRGTADVLTMLGCGFEGSLTEFRRQLRRAREQGLIQGDLVNFVALATMGPVRG